MVFSSPCMITFAQVDYAAPPNDPNQLSCYAGEKFIFIRSYGDGWSECMLENRTKSGILPTSFHSEPINVTFLSTPQTDNQLQFVNPNYQTSEADNNLHFVNSNYQTSQIWPMQHTENNFYQTLPNSTQSHSFPMFTSSDRTSYTQPGFTYKSQNAIQQPIYVSSQWPNQDQQPRSNVTKQRIFSSNQDMDQYQSLSKIPMHLNQMEQDVLKKYRIMVKARIPEQTVQQSAWQDGITLPNDFFSSSLNDDLKPSISPDGMGPSSHINQSTVRTYQFTSNKYQYIPHKTSNTSHTEISEQQTTKNLMNENFMDDQQFVKYYKMLKAGVPEIAVKERAVLDGVSLPSSFPNGGTVDQLTEKSEYTNNSNSSVDPVVRKPLLESITGFNKTLLKASASKNRILESNNNKGDFRKFPTTKDASSSTKRQELSTRFISTVGGTSGRQNVLKSGRLPVTTSAPLHRANAS